MEEACGLFGIFLPRTGQLPDLADLTREVVGEEIEAPGDTVSLANGGNNQAAQLTHYGLLALQHRGQESAGIAVTNGEQIQVYKDMGLVTEVFDELVLSRLCGFAAIGHVRYPTTGSSEVINAQPLVFRYFRGSVAVAHNGNLTNAQDLQQMLTAQGSVFQSTTDSEVIANLIARYSQNNLEEALMKCMIDIKGAYSLLVLGEDKLIGVRDPYGVRPLCVGKLGDGYVLASESCALDTVGAEFIRDLDPGEILVIDENGMTSRRLLPNEIRATCIFEFVYFARPDSNLDGLNVGLARREMGRQLARECQIDADLVISVPDSGTPAALGYAEESGLPFAEGLMKNRYIGRTFIRPAQAMRNLAVRLKLNAVKDIVRGKRVIMVDDSIVRGTTSRQIVRMLREAGATEVHMVISSPPTSYSCYYGIDTSDRKDLIAARMGVEQIREYIGADTLNYLSLEGLRACFPGRELDFCTACFSGDYPIE
ncbi:MAG: amidophosphoribosyltransferase [Syntrophomonadaceae bacterium]|nr:amidophosphoribosyltransferase [Syntrophomonadaceae bacterium]